MHKKLIVKSKFKDYSIQFVSTLSHLPEVNSNTIVVADFNVVNCFPELVKYNPITIKCTEKTKTLNGSTALLKQLIDRKANRYTSILVIGGGILQDLVGFCASIFCRGIQYTLIPTTLLSQVDSCIGGKTSINFNNKKNILGTFYPPNEIIICEEFIKTLTNVDIVSGLGEVFKFHILQNKIEEFSFKPDFLHITRDSLLYKKNILEIDEFDLKERQYLNFGHTFGHALEATSQHKIPHGIAVIIGCMIAINVSKRAGFSILKEELIYTIGRKLIASTNLKLYKKWFDSASLIEITKTDKKSKGDLTMVLMNRGKPFLETITNMDIVKESINYIYESI